MKTPTKSQRSKKARAIRKEAIAAAMYPGLHHPSHVAGVARCIRLHKHKVYKVNPVKRCIEWRVES